MNFILFADKRFSTNNNPQTTPTTTVSSSSSPVSEKRAAITASKKSSSATKHVNQTTTPVANKTSHAKGERSLSILFQFYFIHLKQLTARWRCDRMLSNKKMYYKRDEEKRNEKKHTHTHTP